MSTAPFDVSVVIPVFNRAATVRRAIDSALAQSRPVLEVLVVDDGSSDGSGAAVAAIADPRVRLIAQRNGGAGSARNHGMSLARGSWIAFLDSDDEWTSERIASAERLVDADPTIDFLHSGRRYLRPDGSPAPGLAAPPTELADPVTLLGGFIVKTSAVMVRRALVEAHELRFPTDRMTCEDYDLFWRAILVARAVGYAPELDVTIHLGADGLSRGEDEAMRLHDDLVTMSAVRSWAATRDVDARRRAAIAGQLHWAMRAALASALRRLDLTDGWRLFRWSAREEGWPLATRSLASALLECIRGGAQAPLAR